MLGRARRSVLVVDAGNVTDLAARVDAAASSGAAAAAQIDADLVAEDTQRAVTAYRDRREARTAGRC